jgi:hypothetical protein
VAWCRPAILNIQLATKGIATMTDTNDFSNAYNLHRTALASANAHNKGAVFDALAAAHITRIDVEFDGEGDSGQIESITAFRGDEQTELPAIPIAIRQAAWGDAELAATEQTLHNAVETLCYDCLEQEHGGWENNEGAYGTFVLDTEQRTIDLEFTARFVETFTSNHTF